MDLNLKVYIHSNTSEHTQIEQDRSGGSNCLTGENVHLNVPLYAAEGAKGVLLCDPLEVDPVDKENLVPPPKLTLLPRCTIHQDLLDKDG